MYIFFCQQRPRRDPEASQTFAFVGLRSAAGNDTFSWTLRVPKRAMATLRYCRGVEPCPSAITEEVITFNFYPLLACSMPMAQAEILRPPQARSCERKYPPAEPGALGIGPLEAAVRIADATLHSLAT
jgi:hypothetical protein